MPRIGFRHSEESKEKMRLAMTDERREKQRLSRLGENNPNWGGDNIKNKAIHYWARKHLPKPPACPECGRVVPLEITNIDHSAGRNKGIYKRDLTMYRWLCYRCHRRADGRIQKGISALLKYKEKNRLIQLSL